MGVFWLIAGADGVGKSTYAFRNLKAVARTINFVNLDEIARGLSPLDPQAAERRSARVALELCRDLICEGRPRRITGPAWPATATPSPG